MAGELATLVAGNLALLPDDHTVILLPFAEQGTVAPSDAAGALEDLAAPAAAPALSTTAWAQTVSRDFGGTASYFAVDRAGASSLLTRDVTVQAIVAVPGSTSAGPWSVICRGRGTGATEYVPYGLELLEAGSPTTLRMRLHWQDRSGVATLDTGATFPRPAAGTFVLLTGTRRWEAIDRVVCRYYLGADLLAEVVSAAGDIGGGTTGETAIGARWSGGAWAQRWPGWIDELKVTNHEMPAEEVEALWRRLTIHQPDGVDTVRDLLPPGMPIAGDPSSRVQRLLRWLGQGLGHASAAAEELGDLMPDRAYGATLARWERICGLRSKPRDPLATRRARLLAHLRQGGATKSNLFAAVAELMSVTTGDLELINHSNTFTDSFGSIRTERWTPTPAASWSVLGGAARVQAAIAADVRWTPGLRNAPTLTMPLHTSELAYFAAKVTYTALPIDGEGGLYLAHGTNGGHLFFGTRNNGGTAELVYQRYRGNVAIDSSPVVLAGPPPAGAYWLRVRGEASSGLGGADDTQLTLEWSGDGITYSSLTGLVWSQGWRWLGFYARGYAILGGALDVRFSDFLARQPRGHRPYLAYAYADPSPAVADLIGARALMRRFRYAFWHAAPIVTASLLCDDDRSVCDSGPMGAL